MKKVIYTCLVGCYDDLAQPLVVDKDFDYICFSNDITRTNVGIWQIKSIPYKCKNNIRLSRYVKMLPHVVLSQYEYSIWIDANLQITGKEFYNLINEKIARNVAIAHVAHAIPFCDCIYGDIVNCIKNNKVEFFAARRQYFHLKKEGFPKHYGLYENNIILRRHNVEDVVKCSELWWQEYRKYTKRDQFSLMYVYWKYNVHPDLLLDENHCTRNIDFIKYNSHGQGEHGIKMKLRRRWNYLFVHLFKLC